jgi:hypothetical protein
VAVALYLLLLRIYGLLSEDKLDVESIVYLILLRVFNGYEGILEIHYCTLEAH